MLNSLNSRRTVSSPLRNAFATNKVPTHNPKPASRLRPQSARALDYQSVSSILLITKVDGAGRERPIALAFVTQDADGVELTVRQLGELE